jgi:hypothetical protein
MPMSASARREKKKTLSPRTFVKQETLPHAETTPGCTVHVKNRAWQALRRLGNLATSHMSWSRTTGLPSRTKCVSRARRSDASDEFIHMVGG